MRHSIIYRMTFFDSTLWKGDVRISSPTFEEALFFGQEDDFPWLTAARSDHLNTVSEFQKYAMLQGVPILFVLIPNRDDIYPFLRRPLPDGSLDWEKPYKMIRNFLDRERIPYLDLRPHFDRFADKRERKYLDSNRDLYWSFDWHWNIKGNRLAGILVSDHIAQSQIISLPDRDKTTQAAALGLKEF